ncbi:MAG: DUF4349 domain-containing protein [Dermatophilaceae bacterium]|nr:DUF4349 domain-containing protein [Intrasporangiaceae bacterium]
MQLKQLIVIGAASAALLTGCSAGSSGDSDSAMPGVAYSDAGGEMSPEMADEAAARAADGDATTAQDVVSGDYLVREASLGVKVDSIEEAATRVRQIAVEAGGSVTQEQFGDGFYGPEGTDITRYGTMTISVPSEELDATMTELTALGEVRTRSSNSYDVQDEYVDVEARIATLDASITRMRALMDRTEDIKQIVELETALSARQADLDALQARLNSLDQRIATSPITIMLTTTDELGEPEGGIIGALKDAWNAFTTSAAVLITTIGALLPWLVVGGLAGWALITLIRRIGRGRRARAANHAQPVQDERSHEPTSAPEPAPAPSAPGSTPKDPGA